MAPIWTSTPETAKRVRDRIERIVRWVKHGAGVVDRHIEPPKADFATYGKTVAGNGVAVISVANDESDKAIDKIGERAGLTKGADGTWRDPSMSEAA